MRCQFLFINKEHAAMQHSIVELVKGVHVPWGTDQRQLAKTVTDYTDCDSFAAGILNVASYNQILWMRS